MGAQASGLYRMSHETLQWANRQRMKDAQTQCLVLVLANCADPSGLAFGWRKGGDHWGQYMVDHTRMSRSSVYRKIRELRDIGIADPQVIIHDNGEKQYVVQLDLDAFAEWVDAGAEGAGDGHYVVQRARPKFGDDDELSPAEESAALDDALMRAENESHTEIQKLARGVFRHPVESQSETQGAAPRIAPDGSESHAETIETKSSLTGETARDSLKKDSPKKESPPTPSGASEARKLPPIGFGVLRRDYPQADVIPLRVWERAADEFAKLTTVAQASACDAAPRYRTAILKFSRKPINPDKWLREREFERYGPGTSLSVGTPRIFRAEGTEAWEAWCNVLGVLYGDPTRIPPTYHGRGPRGERGIVVPAEWPLGGEGWRVPHQDWVFVEHRTPNFNRYNERMNEIFGRSIMTIRATSVKAHHKRIGHGPNGTLSDSSAMGALVPREWPPAKGEQTERIEVSDQLRAQLTS